MADELLFRHVLTGQALYAVIRRQVDLKAWNGSAFEAFQLAHWTSYAVPLAESPTGSYEYTEDFPATITDAGDYPVTIYQQSGGAAAASDFVLATGVVVWDGSAEVTFSSLFLDTTPTCCC